MTANMSRHSNVHGPVRTLPIDNRIRIVDLFECLHNTYCNNVIFCDRLLHVPISFQLFCVHPRLSPSLRAALATASYGSLNQAIARRASQSISSMIKSCRMNTYEERAANLFRMRTYKTASCNPRGMNTYGKTGGGWYRLLLCCRPEWN